MYELLGFLALAGMFYFLWLIMNKGESKYSDHVWNVGDTLYWFSGDSTKPISGVVEKLIPQESSGMIPRYIIRRNDTFLTQECYQNVLHENEEDCVNELVSEAHNIGPVV